MSLTKSDRKFLFISLRYFLILILSLGNLAIFYKIFTPLTINFSVYFLSMIDKGTVLLGNIILFKTATIMIVPACIAGSAYFLLTILSLSVSEISITKRLGVLLFTLASFFTLNVARIVLFSNITNITLFNMIHLIGWYFLSIGFVILIWFSAVKIFRLKTYPIYTDFKFIFSKTIFNKNLTKKTKNFKRRKKN